MTPAFPSPEGVPPSPWSFRLVEQLQQFSEVTENLTYRLLELEDRLAAAESELAQQHEQARGGAEVPEAMEAWLEDTEQRLGRVEELLRGGGTRSGAAAGRPLIAVAPIQAGAESSPLEEEIDPFPEEEEQDFLDEQIA